MYPYVVLCMGIFGFLCESYETGPIRVPIRVQVGYRGSIRACPLGGGGEAVEVVGLFGVFLLAFPLAFSCSSRSLRFMATCDSVRVCMLSVCASLMRAHVCLR